MPYRLWAQDRHLLTFPGAQPIRRWPRDRRAARRV
jgi:hypothetical protein